MGDFKEIVKNVVNHPLMAPITDAGKNVVKCAVMPVKGTFSDFTKKYKDLGQREPGLYEVQKIAKAMRYALFRDGREIVPIMGGFICALWGGYLGGVITHGVAATSMAQGALSISGLIGGMSLGIALSPLAMGGVLMGAGAIVGCIFGAPYGVLTGMEKVVKFALNPKGAENTAQQAQAVVATPVQSSVQNAPLTVAPDLMVQVVDGFTRMTDTQRSDALAALKGKCPEAFKAAGLVERTADDLAQTSTRVEVLERMKIRKRGAAA